MNSVVTDAKKELCIVQLTNELPVLRTRLGLSQEEIASRIGISRQTYNSIECQRRPMTWNTCVSLMTLFVGNAKTANMLRSNSYCCELLDEIMSGE